MTLITEEELVATIKYLCHKAGSVTKAARLAGISIPYLHSVSIGRIHPGPAIQKWLGYRRVVMYEKIDECENVSGTESKVEEN